MQARYYAKLYNHDPLKDVPVKLDTDRGIIYHTESHCMRPGYECQNNIDIDNYSTTVVVITQYPLHIFIAIVGICCVNLFITKYESYQHTNSTRKVFNSIYCASVIIAGVINIICLVIDILWLIQNLNLLDFL